MNPTKNTNTCSQNQDLLTFETMATPSLISVLRKSRVLKKLKPTEIPIVNIAVRMVDFKVSEGVSTKLQSPLLRPKQSDHETSNCMNPSDERMNGTAKIAIRYPANHAVVEITVISASTIRVKPLEDAPITLLTAISLLLCSRESIRPYIRTLRLRKIIGIIIM